ncbi:MULTISPECIES: Gfo/Idh/MocA family oxidoreductase [Actinoplanes]|uniref:Gfo/Idh/MocA family protein n=1 Tax=Actinoplanes TaxID=1865 RepID=UPI0005F2EDFA|nr:MULTISPECIES: Gfo/Idh/MocA family oxidoreductase [Actinoplanes]GLY05391.1 hypothetical protein Acsp01_57700 [Actinoplanes sp. NBRC 101535]
MSRPLRVGLVGLGVIARYYRAALDRSRDAELVAVCDRDPSRFADYRGVRHRCTRHEELIASGRVDALVITTPNDSHAVIAGDALAAGLAVCVEKPLAVRLADGERLHRQAQASGGVLMTAFHRRYNAGLRDLPSGITGITVRYRERIEEHVGEDAWYLDPRRCGGGCVADNGPNAFDLVRFCSGDGAVRLLGATVERDAEGVDRRADIRLEALSPDGRVIPARVELDWAYPGEHKVVELDLAGGGRHVVDLLAGHPGFKESLWHEYEGIVSDLVKNPDLTDAGLSALRLVDAVYGAELAAAR